MENVLTQKKAVAAIGEDIGLELGNRMVKDYQNANPNDVKSYLIGSEILKQILAQPGVCGIQFYNAYNELGQKTLVYVGVDAEGVNIVNYTVVSAEGMSSVPAIVADRIRTSAKPSQAEVGIDDGSIFIQE